MKIVDDIIIWATTSDEMWSRINVVLERCKSHNITISRKKLEIGEEIEFAGHVISSKGIKPDPSKFQAIRDFPAPKKQSVLVQCGSSSLTSAQGNYATIELECLAIQYALSKSEFYLRGLPNFAVWTDHRPLVGIFNKALHTLNNQRLIRIREKLLDFSFSVT